ncbi:extracellular solute-binding protein [Nocardioides sp. C4-1]|uniref:extracellular solute-binding protein n=1 Tax=Nocardioides sp. C4-1 TaxID=3151851 RepID=UPI003266719D
MKKSFKVAAVVTAGVLALSACTSSQGGSNEETINIVGFAVPEAANDAIEAQFQKTADGEDIEFSGSYGASGEQSRKVLDTDGKDTDYVHFSLASDVTRLVDGGLIDEDWDQGPNKGIVSSSVAVIAVEEGNPLGIKTWEDLLKPEVQIITADPASSGAARWNIMALYSDAIERGLSEEQADQFLLQIFRKVTSWAASGREATEAFKKGVGNVLITYENEAILARQNGETLDYVVPPNTFLIENPGAVLKNAEPQEASEKFLEYVLSDAGQTEFVKKGFRPINDLDISGIEVEGTETPDDPFPAPTGKLSTITELGGWGEVSAEWFGKDGEQLRFDRLYAQATGS